MNFFDNKLIINIKHLAVLYNMRDSEVAIFDSLPEGYNMTYDNELKKANRKLGEIDTDICSTWCDVLQLIYDSIVKPYNSAVGVVEGVGGCSEAQRNSDNQKTTSRTLATEDERERI